MLGLWGIIGSAEEEETECYGDQSSNNGASDPDAGGST